MLSQGSVGGRPRKLLTEGKVALVRQLVEDHNHSVDDICSTLGIFRSTLYRYVREAKKAPPEPPT
ncbi:helix-turn-helix domain-containing protein [Ktedonobacter sp. SOSP1-85]|uniref:helix-turn-helix domain-containing protein n=1 Tax=Ktedonobacter sp. SOSP1-85 TaxID=2778367 RepID=UPI0027DCB314|nr:helix-turn-helix domain-containing protein [Ktedonobacter sp. SOSP1-85]